MIKLSYITLLFSFASLTTLAQLNLINAPIKSVENKFYLAVLENGQIIKGEPYPYPLSYYPLILEQNKKEYDIKGLLKKVYYPNTNLEYKVIENIYYNERDEISRLVYNIPKFNDSLVMDLVYDFKGNFEKLRINKSDVGGDSWLSGMFGKRYYLNYKDSDCHNYYITSNDSINQIEINEFNNLELIGNHVFNLFDAQNNLILKREMIVKDINEGNLLPKKMDTMYVKTKYIYNNSNTIIEKFEVYERKRKNKGDIKSVKYLYEYTDNNKLKQVIKTTEYDQLKEYFFKIQGGTVISKEVHEYLDADTKHVINYYNNQEKLEESVTEIYTLDGNLKEKIIDTRTDWRIYLKFDEKDNLVSYVSSNTKRNKIKYNNRLEYNYNDQGDWIQCVHFDNLKNKPLYIEERTVEYY